MAQKAPQDIYAQRAKELAATVQRLKGWLGTDPSKAPELVDALLELTAHRLLGHGFALAGADAQDAVVRSAKLVAQAGPIGPYTVPLDAARYITAVVHVAATQAGLGLGEAAGQTIDDLVAWKAQLPNLKANELVAPRTDVWALHARARAALASRDVAAANTYADAARLRLSEGELSVDGEADYMVLDIERLVSDARWAAGLDADAIDHIERALEVYQEAAGERLAQPGPISPGLEERLAEPLFGLYSDAADRLIATGDLARGLQTRRKLVDILKALPSRRSAPTKTLAVVAQADLATDLIGAGRAEEGDLVVRNAMDVARSVGGDALLRLGEALGSVLLALGREQDAVEFLKPIVAAADDTPAAALARHTLARAKGKGDGSDGDALRAGARGVMVRPTAPTLEWAPLDSRADFAPNSTWAPDTEEQRRRAAVRAEARVGAERAEAELAEAASIESGQRAERQRAAERRAVARAEAQRLAAEQAEADRVAAEKAEAERLAAEEEAARAAARAEREARIEEHRLAAQEAEAERRAAAKRAILDPEEAERLELEQLAAEIAELERQEAEQAEVERLELARIEAEELAELERLEAAELVGASDEEPVERVEADRVAGEEVGADEELAESIRQVSQEAVDWSGSAVSGSSPVVVAGAGLEPDSSSEPVERVEADRVAGEGVGADEELAESIRQVSQEAVDWSGSAVSGSSPVVVEGSTEEPVERVEADRVAGEEVGADEELAESIREVSQEAVDWSGSAVSGSSSWVVDGSAGGSVSSAELVEGSSVGPVERVEADRVAGEEVGADEELAESRRLLADDDADPEPSDPEARQLAADRAAEHRHELARLAEIEVRRLADEQVERERVAQEDAARAASERESVAAEQAAQAEAERITAEEAEAERLAAEQAEAARVEAERQAAERQAAEEAERERLAAERAEAERQAAEEAERERLAAERAEAERLAAEQAEAARAEAERLEAEKAEAERQAAEEAERERLAAERAEAERLAAEQAEAARAEAERLEAEKAEAERQAAEEAERERLAAEQAEAERLAAEQAEAARVEAERLEAEQAEAERQAAEGAERERLAAEQAEAERLAAEQAEAARVEAERLEAEKAEAERQAAEEAERERLAAERAEAERQAAEEAERERLAAEQAEAERQAAEEAPAAADGAEVTKTVRTGSDAGSADEPQALVEARAELADARAWGSKRRVREACEGVVEALRPLAEEEPSVYGLSLVDALNELVEARKAEGDWWRWRTIAKEAKNLTKKLAM